MPFNELDIKRIEKQMDGFMGKRRPPVELRNEVDLGYRIKGSVLYKNALNCEILGSY